MNRKTPWKPEPPHPADVRAQEYFERFGKWPSIGRFEDFDEHDEKVKKALTTGRPIPEKQIPPDMEI